MDAFTDYMHFMGIDSFPEFDVDYFAPEIDKECFYAARAAYDPETKKHTLYLPKGYTIDKFLLYHELTHILDRQQYNTGDFNHDVCLAGYMEYHASQVEMMVLVGAESIKDRPSFSLLDHINSCEWTFFQYIDNKLNTAKNLFLQDGLQDRFDGINVLYNFFGLRSICLMYGRDFKDQFDYHCFLDRISSIEFSTLRRIMTGWLKEEEIENACGLYSQVVTSVNELSDA